MTSEVYGQLDDALDRLPNGFARTSSNVEVKLLKKIFSPEDAAIGSQLGGSMESFDEIAERIGLSPEEARTKLTEMAKRGLMWSDKREGKPRFRLAPFVVDIYEAQLYDMDHELVHLFEEYMVNGGAAGIMGPEPALHRVIPAHGTVKTELILPYDP